MRVCVLRIEGTNCEDETFHAFESVGALPEKVHLKQLTGDSPPSMRRDLEDYQVLALPGGFSSGDYVRAGAIFAARIKSRLRGQLTEFVEEGRPVLGICNGFQILVELGLLPGWEGKISEEPRAALATNASGRFECLPTLLRHEAGGNCLFTRDLDRGRVAMFPSAHAEGNLRFPQGREEEFVDRLAEGDQVVFRYVDPEGRSGKYPWDPNGSVSSIAGICNPQGNVLGLMPHPERAFHRWQHPDWTRGGKGPGDGRVIFESCVRHAD
ncbi:MAG: phosphoribosylformylglycinamidine synthase subunit PurQ [Methanomassiliicoccales archaeon]